MPLELEFCPRSPGHAQGTSQSAFRHQQAAELGHLVSKQKTSPTLTPVVCIVNQRRQNVFQTDQAGVNTSTENFGRQ